MKTPELETDRLLLRPFCSTDAQEVFDCWESDPDVAKYMFWTSHNDIEKTRQWLEFELSKIPADDWFRWAAVKKDDGSLIGTGLIYFEPEYQCFEIGYNLGKKYWHQGYTTEMMREVLAFAKNTLGLKSMVGRCAKENPASGHVMKKLGFTYVRDIPYEANDGKNHYQGEEYSLKL